jgi:hypothetical protein
MDNAVFEREDQSLCSIARAQFFKYIAYVNADRLFGNITLPCDFRRAEAFR